MQIWVGDQRIVEPTYLWSEVSSGGSRQLIETDLPFIVPLGGGQQRGERYVEMIRRERWVLKGCPASVTQLSALSARPHSMDAEGLCETAETAEMRPTAKVLRLCN
ncbi:hypothetical protein JZ751_016400 [Albula glossodonta]|uniref:Uncharacterized protein n=1 Tax=Albula glossodonta TaxID=121402 RepID=A0A8T2NY85_9TELE|nr:hypothetical protein JZ751_016400 [Albula glossodonta]